MLYIPPAATDSPRLSATEIRCTYPEVDAVAFTDQCTARSVFVRMKGLAPDAPEHDRCYEARVADFLQKQRDDEKEHWMALCNLVQHEDMKATDASAVKSTGRLGPTRVNQVPLIAVPAVSPGVVHRQ